MIERRVRSFKSLISAQPLKQLNNLTLQLSRHASDKWPTWRDRQPAATEARDSKYRNCVDSNRISEQFKARPSRQRANEWANKPVRRISVNCCVNNSRRRERLRVNKQFSHSSNSVLPRNSRLNLSVRSAGKIKYSRRQCVIHNSSGC